MAWFTVSQIPTKFGVLGVLLVTPCVALLLGCINGLLIVPAATAALISRNLRQLFWWSIGLCVLAGFVGHVLSWEIYFTAGGRESTLGQSGTIVLLRLPIDRAFTIGGFGTVVTGTLISGTVRAGERAELLPGRLETRVRGVQMHGAGTEAAEAGPVARGERLLEAVDRSLWTAPSDAAMAALRDALLEAEGWEESR